MDTRIDLDQALTTINRFLTGKLLQSGLNGYVIGMSGGIDSAVSAGLAVRAVGPEKVLGVTMPYRSSSPASFNDASRLIAQFGIQSRHVEISPMIDAYFPEINEGNRIRAGNKMARERMSVLFDIAHETGSLVLGTGNRTEIALGYTTWYGDAACSLNPIGELYKTEVRAVAARLGIPQDIIEKAPSADLWHGQTDEAEIGVTYEQMDRMLARMIDDGVQSMGQLVAEGFDKIDISRVVSLLSRNSFKRHLPDLAPMSRRPIPDTIHLIQ